ncbi:MAG TPA: hypothetical protein VK958_08530 [Methylophilus sp.]|uniref:hypothetical protein n=1 Tax=Methylophilus sp. TaxID=29541 RepID=UPI002B6CCAA4|nr:hypothetical protein [Methylophilus sp.]HSH87276.1 hypothetical protein [Methylophilus sp.]
MSISDEITNRVSEQRLFKLAPLMPPSFGSILRQVYVSEEINNILTGPWEDPLWGERCGYLHADLDRFINGEIIAVAERPFRKGATAYIKQLYKRSEEVWEIRSRDPKPGIRVFGRFAEKDTFVALTLWNRTDLGGPESRAWRDAIVGCKTEWRNLFPAHEPITDENINDYPNYYLTNTYLV